MKYKIKADELKSFIANNYKSKEEFRRALKISKSHLYALLKSKVQVGSKVYKRLIIECQKYNVEIEELVKLQPMIMGETKIEMINITDKDGSIVASITSENILLDADYKCEIVPY